MAVGWLLFVGVELLSYPWETAGGVVGLVLALSIAGWLLASWQPAAGPWLTVVALAGTVHAIGLGLGIPGALAWAAIPTALAAPLVGLSGATTTAAGQSLLIVALMRHAVAGVDASAVIVALAANWAALGAMYAAYHPIGQRTGWLQEYFEQTQRLIEESRDRTVALKQALESLAQANRQLALANERMAALRAVAEEAQRAKTAFVANVSHEFRTPLNMIIGLVDLMLEAPEIYTVVLSPDMRQDLQVVQRNCEHLSNMVADVLDLTRLEAGRHVLHREQVNLPEIIESSAALVRPLLQKKQLALRISTPDDLPAAYCDRIRIQQVILNLISNAARVTERGGITIEVSAEDLQVVISVTDTGPGISPEDLERIFEPFSQATSDIRRDRGGSGLGLSISRQFVRLHGGQMWAESERGVGTTFRFTLPASSPAEHIARPSRWIREDWTWREESFIMGQAGSSTELTRPRIIVCDETGALHREFARCSPEVELVEAKDVPEVAQALEQCPARAVVLSAAPDGLLTLAEAARQVAGGTPIMACSVPRPAEHARKAGALGHLVKPVSRADLQGALQAVGRPVRRILLVDDDLEVLQLFSRMLHLYDPGLEIRTASSGHQALEELRQRRPDLMLLDIKMPDLDGWQVLALAHQDAGIGAVPAFLVSAQDPAMQPAASSFLVVTMDAGLPLSRLPRCCLEVSTSLLDPEKGPDPVLE
jgi:signal transduction histidine kinase/CheY-like chemotaxis protein